MSGWAMPFPIDGGHGNIYGHYHIALTSGLITGGSTIAAGAPLFATWWSPAAAAYSGNPPVCVITRLQATLSITTAFSAPQQIGIGAYFARNFLSAYSGGTAVTLTGNNQKCRTNMGTSLMSDMRIATTTLLTAPSPVAPTIDANSFANSAAYLSTGTANPLNYEANVGNDGEYPIVLQANEGLVIENLIAFGSTGVGVLTINALHWVEMAGF